jgi:hypothetical protein
MRFRSALTFLILAMALLFALPAGAQPKIAEPALRACPELAEGSAGAEVAASLPRHGGVKPPLRHAAFPDGATTPGGTNPGKALHPGAGRKHGAGRIRRRVGRQADRAARD